MDTSIRYSAANRAAYYRGRAASLWIDALSNHRHAREQASDRSLPSNEGRS
jgi:hypothetical protein